MKKFLVLYSAPAEAMAMMANATDEQKMEGMKPWMAWQEKMGEHLLEMGSPLMHGHQVNPDGSGGNSSNDITGYSMVQAPNIDEAKSMLKDHPHLAWFPGCSINVHECMPMG